jgi:phosphoenolpyruvate carboxylase
MADGFEIDGVFAEILGGGNYGNLQIVDQQRADAFMKDPAGRCSNAIAYLDANIKHYDLLDSKPLHPHSWRNRVGSVDPVDTLTLELLSDLRKSYVKVREAIERFEESVRTGTTGGSSV